MIFSLLELSFQNYSIGSQGIYARSLQGNASAENAALFGDAVEPLAVAGLKLALQTG